jgi:hypothetical protein
VGQRSRWTDFVHLLPSNRTVHASDDLGIEDDDDDEDEHD